MFSGETEVHSGETLPLGYQWKPYRAVVTLLLTLSQPEFHLEFPQSHWGLSVVSNWNRVIRTAMFKI